jgi:hypothetical protein
MSIGNVCGMSLYTRASFSARGQVPYLYKITSKITVLHILIFSFLSNLLEYKMKLKVADIPRIWYDLNSFFNALLNY